jgi:Antirepressor regulating drug resistance, predicted signal transduction N-terminal membrane component
MEWVDFVFKLSLSGSILFLVISIFKPLTKKIFSDTWHYYMLVLTMCIFILPIGNLVALPKIIDYKVPIPTETVGRIMEDKKISQIQATDNEKITQEENPNMAADKNQTVIKESGQPLSYRISVAEIILGIWITGMSIFLGREIYVYKSFYKKLRAVSDTVGEDSCLYCVLENCKKALNINKKIIIKESLKIKSPMIAGIFNPIIIVPKMEYSENKLEMIFTHELIHYKRKDLIVKIFALIVNIINWFNPIVYIIRSNINVVCELSLDEQMVKNFDKSKRKYYGEVILDLIEYSQNRSLIIGTSVCKSRRELEKRLKNIVYFQKSKKLIASLSLIVAILFTSTSVFAANNITSNSSNKLNESSAIAKVNDFAVFVADDGLYMSELKDNNPVKLDEGAQIKKPVISKDGLFVAYIKDDNLFVCNISTKEKQEVAKAILGYNFDNKGELIYSTNNTGMSKYNADTKKSTNIISNEYKYYNIYCDSKNKVYANKKLEHTEGKDTYSKSLGIISFDLDSNSEKVLLESKEAGNEEIGENYTNSQMLVAIGSTPTIYGLSNDDKYIYIWNKPNSGSMSSDITEFVVYDIENSKLIEGGNNDNLKDNNVYGLAYKNNISQNPLNSKLIAVNAGQNRDMFDNKTLGVFNIDTNKFVNLLPENQVSMTPAYSKDGKSILYSSSNKLEYKNDKENLLKTWQSAPHNIYEINLENQKGKNFDFMPVDLDNNEVLFVRADGDSFSLMKTKDGVETKLGDSLSFQKAYTNTWYYGHYKTEMIIDVFVK